MEILLKENQKAIFSTLAQGKAQLEAKHNELTAREQELVVTILEALGLPIVKGIQLYQDKIVVPVPTEQEKIAEAIEEIIESK